MTDRITNADVPRMLREMSPAARRFAAALTWKLHYAGQYNPLELLQWVNDGYVAMVEDAESGRTNLGELERAEALRESVLWLLRRRYEIRDRWGK